MDRHRQGPATPARRNAATPVIVRKSALDDNVPSRDLHVTKGHSLYFDGALIPVEFLINYHTILWDDRAQEVTLYHIELETHECCWRMARRRRAIATTAIDGCSKTTKVESREENHAPRIDRWSRRGRRLARLVLRAGHRKSQPMTDDPGLHLAMNGRRLDAVERVGDVYVFLLPGVRPTCTSFRAQLAGKVGSGSGPAAARHWVAGYRRAPGHPVPRINPNDERLSAGFHAFEPAKGLRWTNGDATLPTEVFAGFTAPLELVLHVGASTRYPADSPTQRVA